MVINYDSASAFIGDNGLRLCVDCDIKLDPSVHRFCYGCGKKTQEMVSNKFEKKGNNFLDCSQSDLRWAAGLGRCDFCGFATFEGFLLMD